MESLANLVDSLFTEQRSLYQATQRPTVTPATVRKRVLTFLAALFKFAGAVDEMEAWSEYKNNLEPRDEQREELISTGSSYLLQFAEQHDNPDDGFGATSVGQILANEGGSFDAINEAAFWFMEWSRSFRYQCLPVIADEFDKLLCPARNPEMDKWVIRCIRTWSAMVHRGLQVRFPVYSNRPETVADCVTLMSAIHCIVRDDNRFTADLLDRQMVAGNLRLLIFDLKQSLHHHDYHEVENRERDFELLRSILAKVKLLAPLGSDDDASVILLDVADDMSRVALRSIIKPLRDEFQRLNRFVHESGMNVDLAHSRIEYLCSLNRKALHELATQCDINPDDHQTKTDLALAISRSPHAPVSLNNEDAECALSFWKRTCEQTANQLDRIEFPELSERFRGLIAGDVKLDLWRNAEQLVSTIYAEQYLDQLETDKQFPKEPGPTGDERGGQGDASKDIRGARPKPGFLDLIVDEGVRTIRRVGRDPMVIHLYTSKVLWAMFMAMYKSGETGATKEALENAILNAEGDLHAKHANMHRLREELGKLAVAIPKHQRRLVDDITTNLK